MSASRVAGTQAHTMEIDGKTYTLRPHLVGVVAEMEDYVRSLRGDPLAIATEACKHSPVSQHDAIWRAAIERSQQQQLVSAMDMATFENSLHGLAFKLWVCLRDSHGEEIKSPRDALNLLEKAGEEKLAEINAKVHQASGEGDLKNSSGPIEENRATANAAAAAGLNFTSISQTATDGIPGESTGSRCTRRESISGRSRRTMAA
jgi:hypothetical protein